MQTESILSSRHLRAVCHLMEAGHDHPHFTDEEVEAQKGKPHSLSPCLLPCQLLAHCTQHYEYLLTPRDFNGIGLA